MINGILAAALCLLCVWVCIRLAAYWDQSYRGDARVVRVLLTIVGGILSLGGVIGFTVALHETCGDLGLALWQTAVTLVVIVGLLVSVATAVALILFLSVKFDQFNEKILSPKVNEVGDTLGITKTTVYKTGIGSLCLAFLAVGGWLGSQPNPLCGAEALVVTPESETADEIRAVLEEHAPDLIPGFNDLVAADD